MKTITIKKIQGKILTYKKNGKTFRLYDNILTDSFIKEFISNGTEEEIKERIKMFNFPIEGAETPGSETKVKRIENQEEFIERVIANKKNKEELLNNSQPKKRGPKKRK